MPLIVLVTADQIKAICPKLHIAHAQSLAAHFNTICPEYGIISKNIFHEFFATLCEECNQFTRYEENLTYSAKRIAEVWPNRFASADKAMHLQYNPKALAMEVYGMRRSLGNLTLEDGYTFRGSGPIQITGRGNVTQFSLWMQHKTGIKKTPEEWAELLRTKDEYGVHSACWIFAIAKKLIDEAERDEFATITKRINGALTNYPRRLEYFRLAKKIIV